MTRKHLTHRAKVTAKTKLDAMFRPVTQHPADYAMVAIYVGLALCALLHVDLGPASLYMAAGVIHWWAMKK